MPAHVVEQVGQVHDAFLREGGGEPDELAVGNHARGDFDEMLSLARQEAGGRHRTR